MRAGAYGIYRRVVRRMPGLLAAWVRSPVSDVALALSLAIHSQLEIWRPALALGGADVGGLKSVLVPTALLVTLPLALRRRFPFSVLCVVAAAMATQALVTTPAQGMSGVIAFVVAVYSVAAHTERRSALAGLAIILPVSVALLSEDPADYGFLAFMIGAPWLTGRALRTARLHARELERLTAQLTSEREERARLAVAAERARIARELHDVVAHSVSTMVVQAEAGEALLEGNPERAREAFHAIQHTGREALAEMRRLLGLLRRGDPELALVPQPSMVHLETLLTRVRDAGVTVDLKVEGRPWVLPPGLDLSAYRIVQEALTNTLKHSGGARAWVTVRYQAQALELEIVDDGQSADERPDGGQGIAGMRERVMLFGGELDVGRRSVGGYSVRASLPLQS
jgi:signal transduction histidine kinase